MSEKVSRRKWAEAIKLAEVIVHYERILEGDFDALKENARKRLKNKMGRAKKNPLAIALLPQARKIIHQETLREEALESTIIGQLRETLQWHILDKPDSDETLYLDNEIEDLFYKNKPMEEILDKFSQNLKKGDLGVCMREISSLLDWAILEIRDTDLPPKASEYIYPHRPRATSTSRYVN